MQSQTHSSVEQRCVWWSTMFPMVWSSAHVYNTVYRASCRQIGLRQDLTVCASRGHCKYPDMVLKTSLPASPAATPPSQPCLSSSCTGRWRNWEKTGRKRRPPFPPHGGFRHTSLGILPQRKCFRCLSRASPTPPPSWVSSLTLRMWLDSRDSASGAAA